MPWKGGHTSALGEQVYDTPEWLAEKVVRVAREEGDADLYVELGVGGGALWMRIPSPKIGVELRAEGGIFNSDGAPGFAWFCASKYLQSTPRTVLRSQVNAAGAEI